MARAKSKRDYKATSNTAGMIKASNERWDKVNHYKEIAENKAKGNRYGQEDVLRIHDQISAYIEEQRAAHKPLTIAGIERASGIDHTTFRRYVDGDLDYKLFQFMDTHGISYDNEGTLYELHENGEQDGRLILLERMSTILKNARALVQDQLESNCYTNKGNPAGSIFGLKAAFGWQDQPAETRTTNNNTLVLNNVATLDEAAEAIKRLTE